MIHIYPYSLTLTGNLLASKALFSFFLLRQNGSGIYLLHLWCRRLPRWQVTYIIQLDEHKGFVHLHDNLRALLYHCTGGNTPLVLDVSPSSLSLLVLHF